MAIRIYALLLEDGCKVDSQAVSVDPFTDNECLALIEDAKLSRHQYQLIRLQAKSKNADIFVPYFNLEEAKKECYPPAEAITITEKSARIKLQDLLDHTASRLLQVFDVKESILTENVKSLTLVLKYGCDGASDQSKYKQKLPENMKTDESIFMISMVPIKFMSESDKVLWENPHPGSTKLCVLIGFQYAKETKELTLFEMGTLKNEIDQLVPLKILIKDFRISVDYKILLTMVDGKVCQNLSQTPSAATCYICKANPTEMNDLNRLNQKYVHEESFQYGLSSLHAKKNLMECLLKISYRLVLKVWKVSGDENKAKVKAAKERIQQAFRKEMGLIIDMPRLGSGTSNDGNTAR